MTTIKDVAMQLNITSHAIRFYEKEGLINIPRDKNGNRNFDNKSIAVLRAILYYRNLGLNLKQIKSLMEGFNNHEKSLQILRDNLDDLETKIRELQATTIYVKEKIELHEILWELDKKGARQEEKYQAYLKFLDNMTSMP